MSWLLVGKDATSGTARMLFAIGLFVLAGGSLVHLAL